MESKVETHNNEQRKKYLEQFEFALFLFKKVKNKDCKITGKARAGESYTYFVAPRPSFVFFIIAVKGASRPPVKPMRSPSDHPIIASKRKPKLLSVSFGAAY